MKQKELLHGIIGFLLGFFIAFFFFSNMFSVPRFETMMGRSIVDNRGTFQTNSIDEHFIEQMIPHHEDAIVMAEIALERSQRDEIKKLSQNIISDQSKEINDMRTWYKSWFGREPATGIDVMNQHGMVGNSGMHMGMMGDETDIESLNNATEFDKEFLTQMIPHHQMAVMMAQMLKNSTSRSEMKQLAENIITSQTKEIILMREWLKTL